MLLVANLAARVAGPVPVTMTSTCWWISSSTAAGSLASSSTARLEGGVLALDVAQLFQGLPERAFLRPLRRVGRQKADAAHLCRSSRAGQRDLASTRHAETSQRQPGAQQPTPIHVAHPHAGPSLRRLLWRAPPGASTRSIARLILTWDRPVQLRAYCVHAADPAARGCTSRPG
jgi:hypothetical protein